MSLMTFPLRFTIYRGIWLGWNVHRLHNRRNSERSGNTKRCTQWRSELRP